MKKMIQSQMTYKLDRTGNQIHKDKTSFGTLEKAIETAEMFIYRKEKWIDTTVISISIINKETGEELWTYDKEVK